MKYHENNNSKLLKKKRKNKFLLNLHYFSTKMNFQSNRKKKNNFNPIQFTIFNFKTLS